MITQKHIKFSLASWSTGCPMPEGLKTCIVVADASHVPVLHDRGYIDSTTVIFAPTSAEGVDAVYEGDIGLQSTEIYIAGKFGVQMMPISLADYIPLAGSQLFRISTEADLECLEKAAKEAVETGAFKTALTSPGAVLANETSLGLWDGYGKASDRLWVAVDGSIRISPESLPLGTIDNLYSEIIDAYDNAQTDVPGCSVAINSVVTEDRRRELFKRCPWLPKYISASGMWKALLTRGIEPLRMSGFGPNVSELERMSIMGFKCCIAWTSHAAYIGTGALGKIVKVSPQIGRLLEAIQMGDNSVLDNLNYNVRKHINVLESILGTKAVSSASFEDTK